jgi:hypothetical protein
MVITKLAGGMGNQMFQYAVGRQLSVKNRCPLYLDCSELLNTDTRNTIRHFALDVFHLSHQQVPPVRNGWMGKICDRFSRVRVINEPDFSFHPWVLQSKGKLQLNGYWQNQNYFNNIAATIRQDFTIRHEPDERIKGLLRQINETASVSLHIRRGDYVHNSATNQFHGVCPEGYYRQAIASLKEKCIAPHFYIFSDDIEWAKTNFLIYDPHTFVSGNTGEKSVEDLRLMAACRHNIIANSSFSWWAGWLNTNPQKIVIAPKQWFRTVPTDIVPETWIKL